ncbi:MAG: trypsin-like peptidase domain-containing protein [Deltaproteobacteria bacterium]|nr:trypsin-like peptidase domain-containing protein [Deltaproteobacteria bacterium]
MSWRASFGAALSVAATTLVLLAAPARAAEATKASGSSEASPAVFETFTKVVRVVEPAVLGIRARTGVSVELSKSFARVGESSGAAEAVWNVVRATVSAPLTVARSFLGATLDSLNGSDEGRNLGSGFVIDSEGHVLTALHTIRGVDSLEAVLGSGRVASLRVIGTDPDIDLALLGLPKDVAKDKRLRVIQLGDSDALAVGQWLVTVGCPAGEARTATVGLVSGLGKDLGLGPFDEYIQTDSAVRAGSSGGPVFDERGKVVGIASTAATAQSNPKGPSAGYAIPIDAAKAVLRSLEKGEAPTRGSIGAQLIRISVERRVEYKLAVTNGALITAVELDGPSARAGLGPGDVIVAVGERQVFRPRDVMLALRDVLAGQPAKLSVDRHGARLEVEVTPTPNPSGNAS